jgi:hypothetical protein
LAGTRIHPEIIMRISYALLLLFVFAFAEAGDSSVASTPVTTAAAQSSAQSCAESVSEGAASGQVAQGSGCCKGNKGVCGCRAGKIICCDKSFAANCPCNQDEPLTTL